MGTEEPGRNGGEPPRKSVAASVTTGYIRTHEKPQLELPPSAFNSCMKLAGDGILLISLVFHIAHPTH